MYTRSVTAAPKESKNFYSTQKSLTNVKNGLCLTPQFDSSCGNFLIAPLPLPEEKMKKTFTLAALFVIVALTLSACGGGNSGGENMLARIKERGYILVSTDSNYEPQSFLNADGTRPADTKCPGEALTAAEMKGFDVDVAIEVGIRLGAETCFMTVDWDKIIAGNWGDQWDISVGSMTVKPPRPDFFYFTTPYYAPTGVVGVLASSPLTSVDQLAGQAVCVAAETTYYDWLTNSLDLNAADIYVAPPADIEITQMPTDQECPQALAAGHKDFMAYATSKPVVDANIAAGMPVKQLGGPVFLEKNAIAFDKTSKLDQTSALEAIDKIVNDMHADGTLSALSVKWYGTDLTQSLAK
jgi:polar amino acid transport system substrate-binding protein